MLGMGLLSWERQRIWQGLLDVQQREILVWGCCYHGKDLLKESPSFSTPERPVWREWGFSSCEVYGRYSRLPN